MVMSRVRILTKRYISVFYKIQSNYASTPGSSISINVLVNLIEMFRAMKGFFEDKELQVNIHNSGS